MLVNSQKPYSEETRQVAEEIGSKYDVSVMPVNCEQLKKKIYTGSWRKFYMNSR